MNLSKNGISYPIKDRIIQSGYNMDLICGDIDRTYKRGGHLNKTFNKRKKEELQSEEYWRTMSDLGNDDSS